jgi:hypothetical protein
LNLVTLEEDDEDEVPEDGEHDAFSDYFDEDDDEIFNNVPDDVWAGHVPASNSTTPPADASMDIST